MASPCRDLWRRRWRGAPKAIGGQDRRSPSRAGVGPRRGSRWRCPPRGRSTRDRCGAEVLVVRRELLRADPRTDCSPAGHQLRLPMPNGAHRVGGGLADAGDLDAAEAARVQAVLGELLPHARTALTEVKTVHAYRPSTRPLIARSIWAGVRGGSDRDGRHPRTGIAPYGPQPLAHRVGCSLVRGYEHLPPVTAGGSPTSRVSPVAPRPGRLRDDDGATMPATASSSSPAVAVVALAGTCPVAGQGDRVGLEPAGHELGADVDLGPPARSAAGSR